MNLTSRRYQRSLRDLENERGALRTYSRAGRQELVERSARRERTILRRRSLGGQGG